jgi:hypothetical protein
MVATEHSERWWTARIHEEAGRAHPEPAGTHATVANENDYIRMVPL